MNGFSCNIIETLIERYGDWVNPKLIRTRIIHKGGSTILESTYGRQDMPNVLRQNLDFITFDYDAPLFPPTRLPQGNADRFFDELDLYSITMTGIGELIFSPAGLTAAAKYCGITEGSPREHITRRKKKSRSS